MIELCQATSMSWRPGGSATQSELIFDRIRALAKETKTPVYTFAEDIAASGACAPFLFSYLAPCDKAWNFLATT